MKEIFSTIDDATHVLRAVHPAQWLLRMLMLFAACAALWVTAAWLGMGPAWMFVAAVAAVLSGVVRPDSHLPLAGVGVIALRWFLVGDAPWWQAVVVAGLLWFYHWGCTLAAEAPPWARTGGDILARWAKSSLIYAGLVVAALGATVALAAPNIPGGLVWAVPGAALLIAAAVVAMRAILRVEAEHQPRVDRID